jgi:hypothetical protein
MRRIPSSLKCFEAGGSLERKTDIKQFGMLDSATPSALRIVADAVINALWSARSLAAAAFE